MTPSMASMNQACQEVDPSFCGQVPDSNGGATAPQGHWTDGPTRITVQVFEPTELLPYTKGATVVVSVYNYAASGAPVEVARGETDASGRFSWEGSAPSPNKDYHFKVAVLAPGNERTFDVPARSASAMAAASGATSYSQLITVACPSGTNPLVCAVAKAQLDFKTIYEQQLGAWGASEQGHAFAADQAHANVTLDHPVLQGRRVAYSWWVGDRGIPPKDWPDLVERVDQTMAIFSKIPFPRWPGIEDLFERCARGVTITQGKDGANYSVSNPRLYSSTWSDYFPREDRLIERDMAVAYSDGLQPIVACMIHRMKQKAKEVERTAKIMSVISLATIVAFSPFLVAAGPGGVSVIGTELWEFVKLREGEVTEQGYGVTAALAASMIAAGSVDFVVAALEPAVAEATKDMDPLTAKAVTMAYPQILQSATDAVLGPQGIGTGFESGGGAVGGAAVAMAVKMIAGIAKGYAAQRIEEFGDAAAGAQQAAADVLAFSQGAEAGPYFKPFIEWVVQALGLQQLFEDAIDQFLDEFMDALEQGEEQGGGVAVVPEEEGGGPAIVPTNAEGVPTDAEGNPLPGGEAPLTKPVDPTKPSTVEIIGAVGVGGVAAALVAVGAGLV